MLWISVLIDVAVLAALIVFAMIAEARSRRAMSSVRAQQSLSEPAWRSGRRDHPWSAEPTLEQRLTGLDQMFTSGFVTPEERQQARDSLLETWARTHR